MLDKPCLVAESVVAILSHTVKMCLMLTVVTVGKMTVFIKSEIINMLEKIIKSSNIFAPSQSNIFVFSQCAKCKNIWSIEKIILPGVRRTYISADLIKAAQ